MTFMTAWILLSLKNFLPCKKEKWLNKNIMKPEAYQRNTRKILINNVEIAKYM
jgi:hypothetical protein